MISVPALKKAIPVASEPWLYALAGTMPKWGITGVVREAAFLGQLRHECSNFTKFLENMNYTDPERIAKIFRTAFDLDKDRMIDPEEIEFAKKYVRQPEKLANRAYANRFGNGDEASGDGFKYRARGPIQTTFKDNYRIASAWCQVDLVRYPEELMIPVIGSTAACGYWKSHGCNELADYGNLKEVTRQINTGLAGLDERIKYTEETKRILEAA